MTEASVTAAMPRLERSSGCARLIVDGEPFLILGGELHNSSSSTPRAIRRAFETISGRGFNTILAPVSWELIEPREGHFDFGLVDELLRAARDGGLRLIPLWFGAWKNGASPYVPSWVKRDTGRFPRAGLLANPMPLHLSPFAEQTRAADAAAFAALMRHLRNVDTDHHTVVMVQVENEVGLLGDSRDRSCGAQRAFEAAVPPAVFEVLERNPALWASSLWRERGKRYEGSWVEVFGDSEVTDEAFMAMAYASHVEAVVAAGKAEFPLPMFVNAWLDGDAEYEGHALAGGQRPGAYPSGGPQPHVAGLWRTFAPSVDLLTPDLYFGSFEDTCKRFREACGGLFVPEMRRDAVGAADVFVAIGGQRAIGTSPFGIDSLDRVEGDALLDAYALLESVAPLIVRNEVVGIHLHEDSPEGSFHLGDLVITARRESGPGSAETVDRGYGLVIAGDTDEVEEVFVVGRGLHLTLSRNDGAPVELLRTEELSGRAPEFVVERVLNGDETLGGTTIIVHSLDPLPPSSFPIPGPQQRVGVLRATLHTPVPNSFTASSPQEGA